MFLFKKWVSGRSKNDENRIKISHKRKNTLTEKSKNIRKNGKIIVKLAFYVFQVWYIFLKLINTYKHSFSNLSILNNK